MTTPHNPSADSKTRTPCDHQRQAELPETQGRTGEAGRSHANSLTIDGTGGTVDLRTEGAVHVLWKPRGSVDADDVQAAMAAINKMCQGLELPLLVDLATTEAVSRDARSIFSVACAASQVALLGSSPVDRLIATLFLGGHIPPRPARFFTSRKEAISWLAQNEAN